MAPRNDSSSFKSHRERYTLFLTHLHSDHVLGIPVLWLTGWVLGPQEVSFQVFGTRGTEEMMLHLDNAYKVDNRNRLRSPRSLEGVVVLQPLQEKI